jgi:flagellar L-ring protein precursor FlgH
MRGGKIMHYKIKFMMFVSFLLLATFWNVGGQTRRSIYSDVKAYKVGDVITIIINEATTSSNKSDTKTSKQNQMNVDNTAGTGFLNFIPGFNATSSSKNQYQGSGQVTTTGQFNSRMSARIQKVLEDGNYLISGTRVIDTNGETQVTEFTGVVRPLDVSPNNTILSSQIADIHIYYKGKGVVEQGHRPGIFTRIINWIL